ncbi:hypothetical protein CEXT_259691 [Caerostris extrusa]|uniref:Secreted protein n=1 Tax=Caerostris extrusa TaxID=172846 RepID=A0AAV4WPK4_CAEEX|nr:hypothetical protein CEXT_259691 [Caerostris extrusa]
MGSEALWVLCLSNLSIVLSEAPEKKKGKGPMCMRSSARLACWQKVESCTWYKRRVTDKKWVTCRMPLTIHPYGHVACPFPVGRKPPSFPLKLNLYVWAADTFGKEFLARQFTNR